MALATLPVVCVCKICRFSHVECKTLIHSARRQISAVDTILGVRRTFLSDVCEMNEDAHQSNTGHSGNTIFTVYFVHWSLVLSMKCDNIASRSLRRRERERKTQFNIRGKYSSQIERNKRMLALELPRFHDFKCALYQLAWCSLYAYLILYRNQFHILYRIHFALCLFLVLVYWRAFLPFYRYLSFTVSQLLTYIQMCDRW